MSKNKEMEIVLKGVAEEEGSRIYRFSDKSEVRVKPSYVDEENNPNSYEVIEPNLPGSKGVLEQKLIMIRDDLKEQTPHVIEAIVVNDKQGNIAEVSFRRYFACFSLGDVIYLNKETIDWQRAFDAHAPEKETFQERVQRALSSDGLKDLEKEYGIESRAIPFGEYKKEK